MLKTLTLLFLILPIAAGAQELKKVRNHNEETDQTEIYQVLKSDPSVRQGSYKKLARNGDIIITGFYKNGLKDSLWIEYNPVNKNIFSKAHYSEGSVTGICEYYDENGNLSQKYDYTHHRLLYNRSIDGMHVFDINSPDIGERQYPVYIGGDWAIVALLKALIRYPENDRLNDVQGTVVISFVIDTNGHTFGYRVKKSVEPALDAEALRVMKIIPERWIPGREKGKAVRCEYNFPISFKLQ